MYKAWLPIMIFNDYTYVWYTLDLMYGKFLKKKIKTEVSSHITITVVLASTG